MDRKVFSLKALTKIYEQIKKPNISIWNMAIGDEIEEKAPTIEVHTKLAGRTRAPLVSRREAGIFVDKQAFEVNTYTPGMIKLTAVNTAEALLEQQFGQTIYATNTDAAAKKELARTLKDLQDIAMRTKLWMLLTLMTTGTCPIGDGTEGVKFDSSFTQTKLTSSDTFKNADFDIVAWLEKQQLKIFQETGIEIDTIIMAPDVVEHFLKNNRVKDDQKNINANLIQLSQKIQTLSKGMKLVAVLPSLNLTIYSYIDWAKEPGQSAEKQLLPEKTIVGFKSGSFRVHYGALALRPKQGEKARLIIAKEVVRPFYPEASEDDEIQYFSAPIIIPEDAKGYFAAKVIE